LARSLCRAELIPRGPRGRKRPADVIEHIGPRRGCNARQTRTDYAGIPAQQKARLWGMRKSDWVIPTVITVIIGLVLVGLLVYLS
jgi:hypothetical protein